MPVFSFYHSKYDLTTSTYPQYHEFDGIYVYNEDVINSKAVRDSLFFDTGRNMYVNFVNTETLYHLQAVGFYELTNNGLYTKDSNGYVEEYIRYGGMLLKKDSFYSGTVPKRDVFDGIFTFTYYDGSTRNEEFHKDGTYTGLAGETGTYTRNGYKIIGISNDDAMPQMEWVVYNGQLTHSFYQSNKTQTSHHDRVRYEYLILLRDYLKIELKASEEYFMTKYEREHPISIQ